MFAFVAALAACGGDSSVSPANEPGLRFLSRAVADTIDAVVTDPVELQLNDDSGAPRANVAVDVTGPDVVGGTRLSPSLGAPSQRSLTVTTDAAGRARLWLRLGVRVGRQWVRATAGTAVDSLGVDILAGQPAQLVAAPADTAIWVGQSYQLRVRVLDRRNNQRDDPVSFATGGAHVGLIDWGRERRRNRTSDPRCICGRAA